MTEPGWPFGKRPTPRPIWTLWRAGWFPDMQRRMLLRWASIPGHPLTPLLCCAAIGTGNLFMHVFEFPYYSDYSWISRFITDNVSEPRWLIHLQVQTAIFHTLDSMFFARPFLPHVVHDPLSMARAFNMLFLVASGLHCYFFYPRLRNTVAWVVGSAAYCFMATGYGKVYGAATAILLMLYCALAESELDEHNGVALGAGGALVGLYYLALLPVALTLLTTLLIKKRRAFLPALLSFVLVGYVLIEVFSGQAVASFFANLWSETHFGNRFTDYVPYRGQASSENSIFFAPSFIFSVKHLEDMLYMLFYSGTLLSFCGACYEAGRFMLSRGVVRRCLDLTPMAFFCCLTAGAYLVIILGYLSKIGPRGDLAFYSPFMVPFTFAWLQLRALRRSDDLSSKGVLMAQWVYMVVIVVWSGIVGPPEI
jgi:hypothetical protein